MTALYADWGEDHPDIAALPGQGISGICRYVSNTPAKNLTAAERDIALTAGLDIVLVWETSAARALAGAAAGTIDGGRAAAQVGALSYPLWATIYAAVDTDTTWAAVEPYLRAFRNATRLFGYQADLYGGYYVIRDAVAAGWSSKPWQTSAWSQDANGNPLVHPAAVLYQNAYHFLGSLDTSEVRGEVNGWKANSAKPTPAPQPAPPPIHVDQGEPMQIIRAEGRSAATLDGAGIAHPISSAKWSALVHAGQRGLTVEIATLAATDYDACIPVSARSAAAIERTGNHMHEHTATSADIFRYDHSQCDDMTVADGKVGA